MVVGKSKAKKFFKAYAIFTVVAVVIIILVVSLGGKSNTKAPSTHSAAKTTAKAPTATLTALNAEAVSAFTPVVTDLQQQMTQGQSYATQPNAINASSAFHTWEQAEQDKQNISNNSEVTAAFNKADNAYYSAHQTAPGALNDWDTDTGNIVSDITQWSNAEWLLLGQQTAGSTTTDQQQTVKNDLQQYQSDLAKAQADIKQL